MSKNSSVTSCENEDLLAPMTTETFKCSSCKVLEKRGLTQHQRSCAAIPLQDNRPNSSELKSEGTNEHLNNTAILQWRYLKTEYNKYTRRLYTGRRTCSYYHLEQHVDHLLMKL